MYAVLTLNVVSIPFSQSLLACTKHGVDSSLLCPEIQMLRNFFSFTFLNIFFFLFFISFSFLFFFFDHSSTLLHCSWYLSTKNNAFVVDLSSNPPRLA